MLLGCGSDVATVAGEEAGETCADQTVEEYCAVHGYPLHFPDSICDSEIAEHVSGRAECGDVVGGYLAVRFDRIDARGVKLYYSHESGRLEFVSDYHSSTLLAGCRPSDYESLICSGVGIICE
jgi:hypothetical protein